MMCPKCGRQQTTSAGCACELNPQPGRRPWKCPVCDGSGKVWPTGDQTSTAKKECPACKGTGIVWG